MHLAAIYSCKQERDVLCWSFSFGDINVRLRFICYDILQRFATTFCTFQQDRKHKHWDFFLRLLCALWNELGWQWQAPFSNLPIEWHDTSHRKLLIPFISPLCGWNTMQYVLIYLSAAKIYGVTWQHGLRMWQFSIVVSLNVIFVIAPAWLREITKTPHYRQSVTRPSV